ncbi:MULTISPECIES: hypothetical protein [Aerococcus]|uniref:hypothetical protein n=1 Tax=Aerococcus TaxID=1375 RepID=UPI000DCB1DA7|nr:MULTISPECIES: hypothetical protein [Aerococcus]KAA9297534.1 hypothetical protein F6I08_07095 [Aerococcus tenax]MDK6688199.1 hypothetical protein [Aerococcus urinae]MDK8484398.1 hypothetical protein [Aerococcus urinae]MDL5179319.1 hypothetical protein [Aerococcus tenax]MDL5208220.1 hypothetical protein [Aerococcus tenax]
MAIQMKNGKTIYMPSIKLDPIRGREKGIIRFGVDERIQAFIDTFFNVQKKPGRLIPTSTMIYLFLLIFNPFQQYRLRPCHHKKSR